MLMQAFTRLTFASSLVTQPRALSRAAMGALVDLNQAPPLTIKEEEGSRATPAAAHRRSTVSTRPARKLPAYVSCRDLGHFIDGVDASVLQEDEAPSKRRSKKHALQALSGGAGDSPPESSLPPPPNPLRHATRKVSRMTCTPPLVFDTSTSSRPMHGPPPIPTGATTPRSMAPRTQPRLFGLEEAPTFYPTWDEFNDPLKYIEWTARPDGGNGVAYGIAKIVPPEGWHMDFSVDQSTFRFRTRVQRLNELSAERRVAQNYIEQLEQFHAQQGHGRVYIPQLCHRPVDLYALKHAVNVHGTNAWERVAHLLGYDEGDVPKCASVLESAYTRLVEPFEAFLSRTRAGDTPAVSHVPFKAADTCSVCQDESSSPLITCVECERAYHLACVTPTLSQVPRGVWVCPTCLVHTGGDFGFEDGETHSLYSFWQRCHAFEQIWAERAGWDDWHSLTLSEREDRVEAEFWRLVHCMDEHVDVEYGADVHSTTHGHASPTMESDPLNVYARSGWNLNNMPILADSLLRYIRSEISGMTAPWIYIGMMFSAFCWHNEDHYTYSINYQHWGATKTWYGVPGADAEAFEAAMERIAPELFAACPDLLLQLVTMMSPALARREGVRMYACNQRPNEFVVTYPKAYHSGLNQGFNLNEAVNFALPDWVMDGLACVRRYQKHARQPVFSHDELLVSIALHNQQLHTAAWLHPAFEDMVQREIHGRDRVRSLIRAAVSGVEDEPFDDDTEIACAHCKTLCYLSHVVSTAANSTAAACLSHAEQVHGTQAAGWTLRVRHPDTFLTSHASRLAERAAAPVAWQQRVRRFLVQHPRPPLRMLRSLVQEGQKIAMAPPELDQLERFIKRAEPWIEHARIFLSKRQAKPGRRTKDSRRRTSPSPPPMAADVDRSPEALLALQQRAASLPFEAPELQQLDAVVDQMHAFSVQAAAYLDRDPEARESMSYVDEAERILAQGELLHVHIPQVHALQQWIAHVRWFAEVHGIGEGFLTRDEVHELEQEADACGIVSTHPMREALSQRLRLGAAWDEKAMQLLHHAPSITLDSLRALLDAPPDAATSSEIRKRVSALEHKAAQWHEAVATLHQRTHPADRHTTVDATDTVPYLAEARQLLVEIRTARVHVLNADVIEAAIILHDQWNDELARILQLTGSDTVDEARVLCERTIRTAQADAINMRVGDEPTYEPIYSYPPVPYPPPRSAVPPCLCFEARTDRAASVTCAKCFTVYHVRCLDRKAKPPLGWQCAFCDTSQLKSWLSHRRAFSQLPLVALLQNPKYQRDQLRFVPSNHARLQAAMRATVEFGVAVSMQFRGGHLPESLLARPTPYYPSNTPPTPQLRHMARRAFACPFNILLIGDTVPQQNQHVPTVLDVFLPAFHLSSKNSKAKRVNPQQDSTDGKSGPQAPRKRAKRARFMFREESVLASLPPDTYCLCAAPDNGTMVQCDRCSHWFHSACMFIDDPAILRDKWYCPVCCFRLRIKYPHAEVKIRDMTRSVQDSSSDLFVDIVASLKSQAHPILKRQLSLSPKCIILHLCEFEPAIPATETTSQPATKRVRTDNNVEPLAHPPPAPKPFVPKPDLLSEEERHRMGRSNLLRRGVSESMMQTYSMGWNGESIVCQITRECHILLGPYIALAQDDPNGTRLLRMALDGLIPWATVLRPTPWTAPAPTSPSLPPLARITQPTIPPTMENPPHTPS